MSASPDKRTIAIVTACMSREGSPAFAFNEVAVTDDEAENGIHYYLAEAQLLQDGFEEPFVHFDSDEAPAFLHPSVREHLALSPAIVNSATPVLSEER